MLIEENGLQHLYNIKENDQSDPDVRYLITEVLSYVETHIKYYGKPKHLKDLQAIQLDKWSHIFTSAI